MLTVPLQKTISTNYALRAIPSYLPAAFIGTLLCPLIGIFAMINAFKVDFQVVIFENNRKNEGVKKWEPYRSGFLCKLKKMINHITNVIQTRHAKLDDKYEETILYSKRSYCYGRLAILVGISGYFVLVMSVLYLLGLWSFSRPLNTWFKVQNPILNTTSLFFT